MLSEFDLISRYFTRPVRHADLGVGDDCALLSPKPGMQTAISSDMLVEGRHFFPDADPFMLGHKSLAVNLSDLGAMGATPVAFTLAFALPASNPQWLEPFSRGLLALADQHGCELIGGDTTRGPLNICITIFGEVPKGQALRRDAAQPGDDIWVSGALGDARLALAALLGEVPLSAPDLEAAAVRLHAPTPRVALGTALRGIARAAIDISDGLIGDLGHILERSGVGATVRADALPAGPILSSHPLARRRHFTIAGGDDYELCFTAPAERRDDVLAAAQATNTPVTCIGSIESTPGLRFVDAAGRSIEAGFASFNHFTSP